MNKFNYSVTHQHFATRNLSNDQRTLSHQKHTLNDYGLLSNAIAQSSKKTKRKKPRKASLQVYSDRERHCESLDKLTFLHQQKNQQIRNHILEKAALHAQNEELKLNLLNPTVRQSQLYSKLQQLQAQLVSMAQKLQDKEKKHKKQIQQIKAKHAAQIASIHQSYSKQTTNVKPSNIRYYQPFKGGERQISPPKQVIRTFQNDKRLIVQNSNDLAPRTYRLYPQNKEKNNTITNLNSTSSQPYIKTSLVEQNARQKMTNTNIGYQNVFIKPQAVSNGPLIYSMNPNFERETESTKRNTPDTSKNTTQTYNYSRNDAVKREQSNLQKSSNFQSREISPQYAQYRNNFYTYEKLQTVENNNRSNGNVIVIKTQKQEKAAQNKVDRPIVVQATPRQPLQSGKTGVSDKQIDDIYKRYYLHDN